MSEILGVDLFGDPVVPSREGPGRPEVVWNLEPSNRVLLAFARGLTVQRTATSVGLSEPTLRKVYFSECAKRRSAKLRMEMTQLARLNVAADKGNVAAEKELLKQLDKMRQRDAQTAFAPAPSKQPAKSKLGKKEQAKLAAAESRGLYDTPEAPSQIN